MGDGGGGGKLLPLPPRPLVPVRGGRGKRERGEVDTNHYSKHCCCKDRLECFYRVEKMRSHLKLVFGIRVYFNGAGALDYIGFD